MNSFVAGLSALRTGKTAALIQTSEGFFSQVFARLTYKSSGIVFLLVIFFFFETFFPKSNLASVSPTDTFGLSIALDKQTKTVFSETLSLKTQVLKFKTTSVADPNLAEDESKIIQAGITGKKVIQTKTTLHNGKRYSVETSVVSETKPTDEIIAVNPMVLEKLVNTPDGTVKYKQKLRVWATSYDPFCRGCNSVTSIGLKAGYGVVAVDPKIIPLRSKIYVPGYGVAIAGDTGGSIKGATVDLGFDNVKNGNWSARYTDLYILEN